MTDTSTPALLTELAAIPRRELFTALAAYDQQQVVNALATNFAARLDRKTMVKSGIVIEMLCHTDDDAVACYIEWSKAGPSVSAAYTGARKPARMEWQRLSDAVDYELGRITLQGAALVMRFSMTAPRKEIETILEAEDVPATAGRIIRSLTPVSRLPERQRDKALRDVDIDGLLLEQQHAMNEALRMFNLLPDLAGRVLEFRIGEGDDVHIVQSKYEADDYEVRLGETMSRDGLLHFFRLQDFAHWLNGHTNVPAIAMEGHLKVDGDLHLLEVLARLPEPYDPAERWASD